MKQIIFILTLLLSLDVPVASCQLSVHRSFARFGIDDTDGISPQEYQQRRSAVLALMDSGSVAVFRSNDSDNRNGDVDYRFRQNDNFLYLTGCNESNCTLILAPNALRLDNTTLAKEILFVGNSLKDWSGSHLGVEGAEEVLGFGIDGHFSIVRTTDKLKELLPEILQSKNILYYSSPLPDILFDPIANTKFVAIREVKKKLEEIYPHLTIKGTGSLVNDLRAVKSSAELVLMQKAIDATVSGYREAMKICHPGMYEYELQAVVEYYFARNGCEYYGFPSIIASGPNAVSIHYEKNRRQMNSEELVVMDIGAEYHGYSADITRTIPVSGTFSPVQKEIYELVLKAQTAAINEVKSNVPMNVSGKKAMEVLGEGLMKLGIIQEKSEVKKYCPHGISHFVGLDVHDVGSTQKLVPGMVLTMEPGLYIPDSSTCDSKYWGIGVRIEDDLLVTESGCKVISDSAPRTIEAIETLMKKEKKSKRD